MFDFKSHLKEAQRKNSGPDGAKFSPIVKPGPRPRTPKASDGSKVGSAGPKKTNLLNKLSGHQVISSVKVKTPSQSSKSQKPKSSQSDGPVAKKMVSANKTSVGFGRISDYNITKKSFKVLTKSNTLFRKMAIPKRPKTSQSQRMPNKPMTVQQKTFL